MNNFKIKSATNIVFANKEKTLIQGDVVFEHIGTSIPFLAGLDYDYQHGVDFFNAALDGEYGPIGDYVEDEPTTKN